MHSNSEPNPTPSASQKSGAVRDAIEGVALPVVAAHRCELVNLEWRREPIGWVLRLYVERLGHDPRQAHGGVTLEECTRISRDMSTALDVAEIIDHAYNLEVSSPGLERPLAKPADWTRFAGGRAKVQLGEPIDAHPRRKVYRGEIVAVREPEQNESGKQVVLREDDLGDVTLPLERIARAHLLIESRKPQPKPGKQKKKTHRAGEKSSDGNQGQQT